MLHSHLDFSFVHFSSFRGREIGDEKMIGILDLEKISYKNVDARGLIIGFQFIQVTVCVHIFLKMYKYSSLKFSDSSYIIIFCQI